LPILPSENRVTHVLPIALLIECDRSDSGLEVTRSQRLHDLPCVASTSSSYCFGPGLKRRIAVQRDQIGNHARLPEYIDCLGKLWIGRRSDRRDDLDALGDAARLEPEVVGQHALAPDQQSFNGALAQLSDQFDQRCVVER
jgi:hypothetical protein